MAIIFDPILGKLRKKDTIPQLSADPSNPKPQSAWVLKQSTGGEGAGVPYGLLLTLTQPGVGTETTYQLSYRTLQGTTVRVSLS